MQQQCIFEMEAETEFFFSDSAYVSVLDGKLYKMFSEVYYSEAESEDMGLYSPRGLEINSP